MKKSVLSMLLSAFTCGTLERRLKSKSEKECMRCGKLHKHNNSWCSPECCKKDRKQAND